MRILAVVLCTILLPGYSASQEVTAYGDFVRLDSLLFADSTLLQPLPPTNRYFHDAAGRLAYDPTAPDPERDMVDVFVDEVARIWGLNTQGDSVSVSNLIDDDSLFSDGVTCIVRLGIDWTRVIWKAEIVAYKGPGFELSRLRDLVGKLRAYPAVLSGYPIATTSTFVFSKKQPH